MNLFISDKKIPVIKLIISLLVGVVSVLLTRISFIYVPSLLLFSISVACFAFLTYYTGLCSLIPGAALFILILLSEDLYSALAVLAFLPPALAAGFSLRFAKRPVTVILAISISYILFELASFFVPRIFADGTFSFTGEFESIASTIENNVSELFEGISQLTGNQFIGIDAIISLAKAVAVGTYISFDVFKSCVMFLVTAALFRVTKCDTDVMKGSIFDIITSKITAVIYVVCLIFTIFSGVSPDNIQYYSLLAQNILLILTPVLIFSGIYYIATVKFKVEHSSPFMLVLTIIVSLLGAYPILIFYLSLSGVTYSLKYSNLKKIEDSNYDEKTQC